MDSETRQDIVQLMREEGKKGMMVHCPPGYEVAEVYVWPGGVSITATSFAGSLPRRIFDRLFGPPRGRVGHTTLDYLPVDKLAIASAVEITDRYGQWDQRLIARVEHALVD